MADIYSRMVNARTELGDVLEKTFPWCAGELDGIRAVFQSYLLRKRQQGVLDYDHLLLHWRALTGASKTGDVVVHLFDPIAYRGQLDGGFVFGYGQAMTEELIHDEGRIITSSLAEYKLPTQENIPPIRMVLLPAKIGPGPFGAKSVGENTNIGVGGAIANANFDAVGVRINASPITAERVDAALQERAGSEPG